MQKIHAFFFSLFLCICILACGAPEDTGRYCLTVDGYKDNFTGYYKINGSYVSNFVGAMIPTTPEVDPLYQYSKNLAHFNSIKVFAFKNSEICSLTISIWKDNREVATISSNENELSDGEAGGYVLAVGPLYYETEIEVVEPTDDDQDDDNPYLLK